MWVKSLELPSVQEIGSNGSFADSGQVSSMKHGRNIYIYYIYIYRKPAGELPYKVEITKISSGSSLKYPMFHSNPSEFDSS